MKLGDIASIIYSVLYLDENIIRTKSTDGDRYECRSIAGIRFFTMPAVPPSTYLFESIRMSPNILPGHAYLVLYRIPPISVLAAFHSFVQSYSHQFLPIIIQFLRIPPNRSDFPSPFDFLRFPLISHPITPFRPVPSIVVYSSCSQRHEHSLDQRFPAAFCCSSQ